MIWKYDFEALEWPQSKAVDFCEQSDAFHCDILIGFSDVSLCLYISRREVLDILISKDHGLVRCNSESCM